MTDRPQPVLPIDGLALRPWRIGDVPALVAAYADPDIRRWHIRSMTHDEAEKWVTTAGRAWSEETAANWAITGFGEKVIGRVTLGAIDLEDGVADIRYWVVPSARGRRIASRAVTVATDWAIGDLGLHRVELEHSSRNVPSCRVAARAGYKVEGTKRSQLLHEDGWHDMHLHAYVFPE